jgi:hypothetical protein
MPPQSSASRVAGKSFKTFEHEGKKYLLSQPLRMGSYSDEEAIVLWKRIDPGEFGLRMIPRLPPTFHASVWEGCARASMAGIPSAEEWSAYNASPWKTAYMLWQTLDPKHKVDKETKEAIDLIDGVQWALTFITQLPEKKLKELSLKIAFVSQDTAIKNSSGRTGSEPEPAHDQQTGSPDMTDGPPSMNTSEIDTSSDPTE